MLNIINGSLDWLDVTCQPVLETGPIIFCVKTYIKKKDKTKKKKKNKGLYWLPNCMQRPPTANQRNQSNESHQAAVNLVEPT